MSEIHTSEDLPPGRAAIGRYRSAREAHEAGLAVLAAGRPYWVFPDQGNFVLLVPERDADWLRREVELTGERNRAWPPVRVDLPLKPANAAASAAVALLLAGIFILQSRSSILTELGLSSSEAVLQHGEAWRLFTAVTLHGDVAHLAGNLAALPIFGYFCARYLGSGVAWLAIFVLAALANLTNVLLWEDGDFRSLGASTAAFAALGLLAGVPAGWYLRMRKPIRTREWLLPLVGGGILFLWLGGGGDGRTDIAGHLWAFLYGVLAAIPLAAFFLGARVREGLQRGLLAAAGAILVASWWAALA